MTGSHDDEYYVTIVKKKLQNMYEIPSVLRFVKRLFFHFFHSQKKIHESYSCMPQIFSAYSFDWGMLSMLQISVANTSDACHEKIDLFKKLAIFSSSNLCKIHSIRPTALNLVSK